MSEFLDLMEAGSNPGRPTKRFGDRNPQAFAEACRLTEATLSGDRYAALRFVEALSTSDFPLLFGDILDRALVGAYQEWPVSTLQIVDQRSVPDFRTAKRFAVDGQEGVLPAVGERAEYPEAPLSDAADEFFVSKFGRKLSLSWETIVNDDLDGFRDAPRRMGRAARRSEAKFIAGLYVDASGPHASLYDSGNTVSANPVLTTDNIEAGLTLLASQTDDDGEPIWTEGVALVVPTALETAAMRAVSAREYREVSGDTERIISGNGLRANLQVVVDPYISQVATSNGDTSWFLFGSPSIGRPALEFDRLRGHEAPEIWARTPDAQRVGGGTVGPDAGSFENDSIDYRVRHVYGGGRRVNTGGKKATVASSGAGS